CATDVADACHNAVLVACARRPSPQHGNQRSMAGSGQSTATLRLKVGNLGIAHPITVPTAAVPATEVLPALQGLVNAVVGAATEADLTISCRKGCAACCRHLVPISRTEGEALLALVDAMPKERRKAVRARFASAEAQITAAGPAE